MVQIRKCDVYSLQSGDALEAKKITSKSLRVEQAKLKWFCSFEDNKKLYEDYLRRKVTQNS